MAHNYVYDIYSVWVIIPLGNSVYYAYFVCYDLFQILPSFLKTCIYDVCVGMYTV